MAINQHASNLVDITAKAFNGDVTNVSPMDGLSLIDSWIAFLKTDTTHDQSLDSSLNDLRLELQKGQFDDNRIQDLLGNLASQVEQISQSADADSKPKLTKLADALNGFQQLMNGSSGSAPTGGQAPMTSTVGGESTVSGAGIAGLGVDYDELSNRNGGTASNEASTADGRNTTDARSSEATGDSSYSEGNSSNRSRSDTSRVEGPGISGGKGDTATTQSGGRSQY